MMFDLEGRVKEMDEELDAQSDDQGTVPEKRTSVLLILNGAFTPAGVAELLGDNQEYVTNVRIESAADYPF